MSNSSEDLGVNDEYADELRERVDPPGTTGPPEKVRNRFADHKVSWGPAQKAPATHGIVFLANAIREVRRRSENHSVQKMATGILLDDLEDAAEEGQLYEAFRQEDPGDFLDGLVEYVLGKARKTIGLLEED
jgi:hypothetical protein